jgi:glycosyltransferase involved in cell wall biosynthesis
MGPRRKELSDLAMSCGVSAAVRFLGYVEDSDIAALYRACHVHVFPSKYEGFGLPLAEALACGAPTITTSATSMPEIAGDAAVLVPPSDLDALSEALGSLCGSESRRAELRRAGPKQSARFSWLECARQTVRGYRKALGA